MHVCVCMCVCACVCVRACVHACVRVWCWMKTRQQSHMIMAALPTCPPECECYGRASSCHYDPTVAIETGGNGGVCDNCTQNTTGRQCDECRPGFYRNPSASVTDADLCLRK